ncbi:MAG: hypothetical protein GEU82_01090 [Luteitalea sp.]|nr:hypothetical protein [Luteitalea sp.]
MAQIVRVLVILLGFPVLALAQEGAIVGSVADESQAAIPGVTVTATDVATARQHVGSTDERGEYRLPSLPSGTYRLQAELVGFTTVIFPNVELLVGQSRSVPFVLKVATLEETVTVTSEAPLVDTQSVQIAGNVDRRQMEELPVSGRNWMELSMLVKGMTANDVGSNRPGVARDDQFQLNLDGQQITNKVAGTNLFGQPGLSREAIAEYQIITNMFDITQGRSLGVQVQAVSRAGTNKTAGTFYGYFRDDKLNAEDFVVGRVLPFANQQIGGSIGGPVLLNKVHYFATYEYERQPNTVVLQPPFYQSSLSLPTLREHHRMMTRGDFQVSPRDHISARMTTYEDLDPFSFGGAASTNYPTFASKLGADNLALTGTWSRVISPSLVSEVKLSYFHYHWNHTPAEGVALTPQYQFPGFSVARGPIIRKSSGRTRRPCGQTSPGTSAHTISSSAAST